MEKTQKDFFAVYEEGLRNNRLNCAKLSRKLADLGFIITPRSLQRYHKKMMCPDFETARWICQALEYDFTDDEVYSMVETSKNHKEYAFSSDRYLERVIKIRIDRLSDQYDTDAEILQAIKQRIADTQPLEKGNLNRYLSDLIREDLANHILPDAKKSK